MLTESFVGTVHCIALLVSPNVNAADPVMRFLGAIFLSFPAAAAINLLVQKGEHSRAHFLSTTTGIALSFVAYGTDAMHLVASVLFVYACTSLAKTTRFFVPTVFVGCMLHLLYLYDTREKVAPALTITASFCVLTLKLIGTVMDLADGAAANKAGKEIKSPELSETPSLLQFLSYVFFPSAVFGGPQFPYATYYSYIHSSKQERKGKVVGPHIPFYLGLSGLAMPVVRKVIVGLVYSGIHVLVSASYPTQALTQQSFLSTNSFASLYGYSFVSVKAGFMKYIGVWMFVDASCMLSGITARQQREGGAVDADPLLLNVRPWQFETATSLTDLVMCWNITTNSWLRRYIYKPLLIRTSSRALSLALAMLFLAVWHGWHIGYFHSFFFEAATAAAHTFFARAWQRRIVIPVRRVYPKAASVMSSSLGVCGWVLWVFVWQYGGIAFQEPLWQGFSTAYTRLYWFGHVIILVLATLSFLLM